MQDVLNALWEELSSRWESARETVALWKPPIEMPQWLAPAVALGGLLSLALLSGVALASLGILLITLLTAYLILERIFGVSLRIG